MGFWAHRGVMELWLYTRTEMVPKKLVLSHAGCEQTLERLELVVRIVGQEL